jgi:hypothetical protein
MRSLYRGYPVGSLLVWETTSQDIAVRGRVAGSGTRQLLLDGQQRVTSMYGLIRGAPPPFFEGDANAFTGLFFNVDKEVFEFYAPTKMAGDPTWVNVTELFRKGPFEYLTAFPDVERDVLNTYLERLNRIKEIENRNFNAEKITGAGTTVDEVVEIFNKVNSGGTKLSKGDLALAKLCAEWPDARNELRDSLNRWQVKGGYKFSLEWLLRNVTAVATGRALFSFLSEVSAADFQTALRDSSNHIGTFLDAASGRLGLDHDRVLMGRYATPVITRLLHLNGGGFTDSAHRDKVLFWYVHSALWGRFSGSTETILQQDYDTAARGGVDALITTLERSRGGQLTISPDDFHGSTRGSPVLPAAVPADPGRRCPRLRQRPAAARRTARQAHLAAGPPHLPESPAAPAWIRPRRDQRDRQLLFPHPGHQHQNRHAGAGGLSRRGGGQAPGCAAVPVDP